MTPPTRKPATRPGPETLTFAARSPCCRLPTTLVGEAASSGTPGVTTTTDVTVVTAPPGSVDVKVDVVDVGVGVVDVVEIVVEAIYRLELPQNIFQLHKSNLLVEGTG